MLLFIDANCQAIYLRTTCCKDIIQAVSCLEYYNNALDRLNNIQKEEISNYLYILKKVQAQKRYALKIKEKGYSTIKAAKDIYQYKKYYKAVTGELGTNPKQHQKIDSTTSGLALIDLQHQIVVSTTGQTFTNCLFVLIGHQYYCIY